MASGNKGKDQKNEDALRAQALAAETRANESIALAAKPTELEERRTKRVLDLDKWQSGESGPVDVLKMPGGDVALDLFKNAKMSRDSGRIGRGYGLLSDGANPNYVASLDKEMGLERDLAASGALEQNVDDTISGNNAELYGLAGMSNSRNMSIAGLQSGNQNSAQDRYLQFLMKPKQPSFLKQLALTAMGGAATVGGAYLGRRP